MLSKKKNRRNEKKMLSKIEINSETKLVVGCQRGGELGE